MDDNSDEDLAKDIRDCCNNDFDSYFYQPFMKIKDDVIEDIMYMNSSGVVDIKIPVIGKFYVLENFHFERSIFFHISTQVRMVDTFKILFPRNVNVTAFEVLTRSKEAEKRIKKERKKGYIASKFNRIRAIYKTSYCFLLPKNGQV